MSNIESIDITEELGRNFLTYAIDTDQNKSFPSVADGFLPGARAALWEMYTQKYFSNKPHVKSAKVASGVIGNWWPHNADATYGTLVRMAQPFIENNLEVDFQGAVGNIIQGQQSYGSSRYTEMRLSPLSEEGLFYGVDKGNCDMIANYTQDKEWPKALPAIFPRLLVNGSIGLGVGLSQYWVGHNFQETADLIIEYARTGNLNAENYYPDFPIGCTIVNKDDLPQINETGKGKIIVEATYESFPKERKIVFTEFPYQVYVEELVRKIKELYNNEVIFSIDDIINSSDKHGPSITVYVAKGFTNEQCVEELYQNTALRSQYNVIQNGIVQQVPEIVNLRGAVDVYLAHNALCIEREYFNEGAALKGRIEVLEGLKMALSNLDKVIEIIRQSDDAKKSLMESFPTLTDEQAKAILSMPLGKLSKLESSKIEDELNEKRERFNYCQEVAESEQKRIEILIERLAALADKYGTPRRTKVVQKEIAKKERATGGKAKAAVAMDVVVTYDDNGYVKAVPVAQYRKGNAAIINEFKCTTQDLVLCFSSLGKMYRIGAKDIGISFASDKGKIITTILKTSPNEKIIAVCPNAVSAAKPQLTAVTNDGKIKKTNYEELVGTTRSLGGIKYMGLDGNEVIFAEQTNGDFITLKTSDGYGLSFELKDLRETSKSSRGVAAIKLSDGAYIETCKLNVLHKGGKLQKRAGRGMKIK